MKLIKRTFFNNSSETRQLDHVTEAVKGIYSTIRLNEVSFPTIMTKKKSISLIPF